MGHTKPEVDMKQLKALVAYVKSAQGQAGIHKAITALLALYVALHRAGI